MSNDISNAGFIKVSLLDDNVRSTADLEKKIDIRTCAKMYTKI